MSVRLCIGLALVLLASGTAESDEFDSDCSDALAEFAAGSSNFTFCFVMNSRPIQACEKCVGAYVSAKEAHERILTAETNGTRCRDRLINLDRLQIVESTFANVNDLWERGACHKCFDWTDKEPRPSNDTVKFVLRHNATVECIDSHDQSNDTDAICKDCMSKYLELNAFYESLKGGKSDTLGICMDVVDLMNATRSVWSGRLNCCKLRRTPELVFLFCTGIVTALPALFYLFARIFCDNATVSTPADQNRMRQERQERHERHERQERQERQELESQNQSASTSAAR